MGTVYDFQCKLNNGEMKSLEEFKDDVLLVVNTASQCGLTGQYKGLEQLYQQYKDQGFKVLGFPCNQFAKQEPGSEEEIAQFCELNYGVTFPLFAKIDVNGESADPLYKFLKNEKKGFLGMSSIKWNFTKFLINRNGEVVKRFAPTDKPESLNGDIEKVL